MGIVGHAAEADGDRRLAADVGAIGELGAGGAAGADIRVLLGEIGDRVQGGAAAGIVFGLSRDFAFDAHEACPDYVAGPFVVVAARLKVAVVIQAAVWTLGYLVGGVPAGVEWLSCAICIIGRG